MRIKSCKLRTGQEKEEHPWSRCLKTKKMMREGWLTNVPLCFCFFLSSLVLVAGFLSVSLFFFFSSSLFFFFSILSPFPFWFFAAPRRYGRGMELLVTVLESNLLFTVETGLLARGRTSRRCFNGGWESVRLPCCHCYCCSGMKELWWKSLWWSRWKGVTVEEATAGLVAWLVAGCLLVQATVQQRWRCYCCSRLRRQWTRSGGARWNLLAGPTVTREKRDGAAPAELWWGETKRERERDSGCFHFLKDSI